MGEEVNLLDELRALAGRYAREATVQGEYAAYLAREVSAGAHIDGDLWIPDARLEMETEQAAHAGRLALALGAAADAVETLALIAEHRIAVEPLTDERGALYYEAAGPHGVYEADTVGEVVRLAVAGYEVKP